MPTRNSEYQPIRRDPIIVHSPSALPILFQMVKEKVKTIVVMFENRSKQTLVDAS